MKTPRLGLLISPIGLLILAMTIAVLYYVAEAMGWRATTSVISGTPPAGMSAFTAMIRAAAFMLLYFAFVLFAPILVIAAGLRATILRD